MEQEKTAEKYQGLFDLMKQEHSITLTCEEMDEIIGEAKKVVELLSDCNDMISADCAHWQKQVNGCCKCTKTYSKTEN